VKPGRPPRLQPEDIRAIREWHDQWCRIPRPQQVAKRLGITRTCLDKIVAGETYRWVQP
jgi:hypothetical protein